MIGELLLIAVLLVVTLVAAFGGVVLSLWLALRAPVVGLAFAGLAALALLGVWLRALGI
jgi:hypothetical protein